MGPLVPYIISEEFGLVIALAIGVAFGFVLEQGGFSSTKKLVGLFYGYDFTVLRVFFTAGITAMAGVLLLGHYGILDTNVIYVNPAFINSALIGGAIMGVGFIIGGFCPGTGVCAAAIGKIDAMAFVGGIFLGVFAFMEFFPGLEKMYLANNLGQIRISEYLGISDILFGILLSVVAVTAFVGTWMIENRVNKRKPELEKGVRNKYALAVGALFVVLGIVAFLPGKEDIIYMQIARAKRQQTCVFKEVPADRLANDIVNNFYSLNLIDVRTREEFEAWHLPLAINIPFDQMLERQNIPIFNQQLRTNIFYADDDTLVRMACLKAKFAGNSDNMILRESAMEFKKLFFEADTLAPGADKRILNIWNFRTDAARRMLEMETAMKARTAPVKREVVTVRGGC